MEPISLSVIVPLYNEEENIELLYRLIADSLRGLSLNHEIVFVDDGSKDRTFEKAVRLAGNDPRLRIVKFRKNYGQTPAMAAGIEHARGEILVTMDGDLQNDPSDIPLLLEKIAEGNDLVCGWRVNRQDHLIRRKIPSKVANWIIGKITGVPIRDNGCSLKAYRADMIKAIPLYADMHRFIPAMASIAGCRIAQIPVRHHARKFGKTKYGLSRIYKVLLDLVKIKILVSFASRPMVWFGGIAIVSLMLAVVAIGIGLKEVWSGSEDSLVVSMGIAMLLGSLSIFQLFSGVLGELIYKTGNFKMTSLAGLKSSRQEHLENPNEA